MTFRRQIMRCLAAAGAVLALAGSVVLGSRSARAQEPVPPPKPFQLHFDPKGKPPSKFTMELLQQQKKTLPFADQRDFEEQKAAVWTAQQIVAAFPDDSAPSYLLRDRDQVYGQHFRHRVKGMGIDEVLTAPHSPWQNPFAERLIGSIRRECLNHVLVLGEAHLRRILACYFEYYHQSRTHLALDKDAPEFRPIELPATGKIVQRPQVGGLRHRYLRQAA
jgi:Integrase core domain